MQESYDKGVANHTDPELCVASREAGCEALVGARAGRVLSPESTLNGVPTQSANAEGNTLTIGNARWQGPCGVGDPVHARKHLVREPGDPRLLQADP